MHDAESALYQRDDLLNCENNDDSRTFSLALLRSCCSCLYGYGNFSFIRSVGFASLKISKHSRYIFVIIAIVDMLKRKLHINCVVVAHGKKFQQNKNNAPNSMRKKFSFVRICCSATAKKKCTEQKNILILHNISLKANEVLCWLVGCRCMYLMLLTTRKKEKKPIIINKTKQNAVQPNQKN